MQAVVTLETLALAVGLDRSTVSRALRDDPKVSAATRERVQAKARELGYRPNPLMAAVGGRRIKGLGAGVTTVAYIQERRRPAVGADHFEILALLCEQSGYQAERFYYAEYPSVAALQRVLVNRGIHALVIAPPYERGEAAGWDFSQFFAVTMGEGGQPSPLPTIEADHFGLFLKAWRKVLEKGYQRIGVILMRHTVMVPDDEKRLAALEFAQKHVSPELPLLRPLFYEDTQELAQIRTWYDTQRPDVIIAFNDVACHFLRPRGVRIPEDVAYVSLHRYGWNPDMAGILWDLHLECEAALRLLEYAIKNFRLGVPPAKIYHLLDNPWVEGSTLPDRPR